MSTQANSEAAYLSFAAGWPPPNPGLMHQVVAKLKARAYNSRSELISELRLDVGLYSFVLRELASYWLEKKIAAIGQIDPVPLLLEAPETLLLTLLSTAPNKISLFDLNTIPKIQARQLESSLIGATTASVLAASFQLNSELAYSCGILRQFGLTLIAFNYPHIYKRELATLKDGESLELRLSTFLGFTPSALAATVASKWGLIPEVTLAMQDIEHANAHASTLTVATTMRKLCEVGEAFARATDPDNYPSSANDWEFARHELEHHLGPNGFKALHKQLLHNLSEYSQVFANKLNAREELVAERLAQVKNFSSRSQELLRKNVYIKSYPPELRNEFSVFYERLDGKNPAQLNLEHFSKKLVPASGFPRGCTFLLDPDSLTLVPRLFLGSASVSEFKSISNILTSGTEPVAIAYRSTAPRLEHDRTPNGKPIHYAVASLGSVQRIGVLYLEQDTEFFERERISPLMAFKALRQALEDCLGVY